MARLAVPFYGTHMRDFLDPFNVTCASIYSLPSCPSSYIICPLPLEPHMGDLLASLDYIIVLHPAALLSLTASPDPNAPAITCTIDR